MIKEYNPRKIEEKWSKFWEEKEIFKFNPKHKGEIYSIDSPPPYASSGHLHVGHALHYTQFEIIARAMRLMGYNVYFAPGFDDNGLPTEKYVEEKLGVNKATINRAEFRRLCFEESKKVEREYIGKVFKVLGHSYDWDLIYTTISPEAQKVAQTSFLRLVKKGNCYQAKGPTIWCPYHETALAQAEVEDLQRTTKLNYIDFKVAGEDKKVCIATTRPEFLPACVGVFVNPEDNRYKDLVGKELLVPLFNNKINVKTDEKVDKNFGTGIVMVCTFGDNTDIEWWKKYKLDLIVLLNPNGTLTDVGGKYKGMSIKEARKNIINDLKKENILKKQEDLEQTVGSCWRCSNPVEYLITKQWSIKSLKYKEELMKRGREIKWHPSFMRVRYEDWVKNLKWDWIISRQRYYGVPIPAWYCDSCNEIIFPEEKELPIDPSENKRKCPKCKKEARPDTDVFDTWMTSSNTPELAGKWLDNPDIYKRVVPISLRPQAHDIIRTWAFYTILKSHLLFNRIPWKDIMIGTYVLDSKGKGMHKSKGNAIWADSLIEKYGVDAFRYWVASASLGSDLLFNEAELVAGKKFLIKLWNASNFVFMNINEKTEKLKKLEKVDECMLKNLAHVSDKAKRLYKKYDIAGVRRIIDNFFWHDFCDNYLEIIKNRIYNGNKQQKESALYVLYETLLAILKMFAPITPFITEEIYQEHFKKYEKEKSIHLTNWPEEIKTMDKRDLEIYNLLLKILKKVRQEKSKNKKSVKAEILLTIEKKDKEKLKEIIPDLMSVTSSKEIKEGKFKVEFVD